jgi:hypothetical protein
MPLVCPTCGNSEIFLVKIAHAHVVRLHEGRVDVLEEVRPTVSEALCGECDAEVTLDSCDEETRRELLLTVGAR